MARYELVVEGMSCGHCVAALKRELEREPGTSPLEVHVGGAFLELGFPPPEGSVQKAVERAGFRFVSLTRA
ncbi:MAG: heavy-metal-associated domain-containing protein [Bacteroidota bacterium]